MMEIIYREADRNDLAIIIKLLANDLLGQTREDLTQVIHYEKAFERIKNDPNQLLIVACEGDKVVGTFQLSFLQYLTYKGGIRAQIEAVRVHKDFRGRGLGRKMIEWAIECSKENGAHMVQLTTDKQRPEAIAFYENLGFTASHEGMKLHVR